MTPAAIKAYGFTPINPIIIDFNPNIIPPASFKSFIAEINLVITATTLITPIKVAINTTILSIPRKSITFFNSCILKINQDIISASFKIKSPINFILEVTSLLLGNIS